MKKTVRQQEYSIKNNVQDMTQGNVRTILVSFAIPLMLGNLFQQFYSMVDTMVVGQGIGYRALAAVGATAPVVQLILGLAIGLTGGLSVVIAQYFGSGNMEMTRKAVINGIYICAVLAVIVTATGIILCRYLFIITNTPIDIIDEAVLYTMISFAGAVATISYNFQAGIMRALGDSKMPFFFLVIASLINIVLDLFLVFVIPLGVAGVAIATIISQIISGILCFLYIRKHITVLHFQPGEWKVDTGLILKHLKVSIPMAFFASLLAVSFLLLQSTLNSLGSADVAAYTAASKMDSLIYQIMGAFGTAISTFAAQNFGKLEFKRIHEGIRKCMQITVCISLILAVFVFCFGKYFMLMFVGGAEKEIISAGTMYMKITSVFYIILGVNFVVRFVLAGIGETMVPLIVGIMEIVVRSVSAFLLIKYFGFVGMSFVSPLCWFTSTLLVAIICPVLMRKAEAQKEREIAI
ncbi:MATE family efflux transporter [Lachnospiraceae bacterium ZAX-1]